MTNNVKWPRAEIAEFFAEILYGLGLVKEYEWRIRVGIPDYIVFTWFWQKEEGGECSDD